MHVEACSAFGACESNIGKESDEGDAASFVSCEVELSKRYIELDAGQSKAEQRRGERDAVIEFGEVRNLA